MKKKLLSVLAVLGAVSMLCGFDSAETADSVAGKMQEASSAANEMSADVALNVDAALTIGDGTTDSTLAFLMTGSYTMDYILDPMALQMDMSMSMSMMGQGEDITAKMYAVSTEDGMMDVYTYTEDSTSGDSGWAYEQTESVDMEEMTAALEAANFGSLSDWGIVFELAPEAADFNGTECYLLSTTIDTATLNQIIAKASELTGEDLSSDEDVAMALSMLDGLKLNLQYYVDTATYLPVAAHLDMNDSDLTLLNQYIQMMMASDTEDSGTTASIALNDVSMDMSISYEPVGEITVPQEAIDAVQAGDADSLDVEDTVESILVQ